MASMSSSSAAAPRFDMLRRIFGEPRTLTPLLRELLAHAVESYGDEAVPQRARDIVSIAIEQNHPAWNVAIACVLVDLVESLRQRVLALNDVPFTHAYLDFLREKCLQLRTSSYNEENAHELVVAFASAVSDAYTEHNTVLIDYVTRSDSINTQGYASEVTVDTLAAERRKKALASAGDDDEMND